MPHLKCVCVCVCVWRRRKRRSLESVRGGRVHADSDRFRMNGRLESITRQRIVLASPVTAGNKLLLLRWVSHKFRVKIFSRPRACTILNKLLLLLVLVLLLLLMPGHAHAQPRHLRRAQYRAGKRLFSLLYSQPLPVLCSCHELGRARACVCMCVCM